MIKKVKVTEVISNPNNPRLIKDDKFKKLVKSIQDFPDMLNVRPIVVNKDMVVLGGNMRLKAIKEAGIKEINVDIVDWNEQQQKEFIVKDNVGYGEWDWDDLANNWDEQELTDWGLDIPKRNLNKDIIQLSKLHFEYFENKHNMISNLVENNYEWHKKNIFKIEPGEWKKQYVDRL